MVKKLRFVLAAALMIVSAAASAQITTSALSGKVTDSAKEDVIGATVLAVHTPSGTQYGAITNIDGRYTINGMRAGGPYKVTISYVGYKTAVYDDVTLALGETYVLNHQMQDAAEQLDEVVISAAATKFSTAKTGAATNITGMQIANLPTVSRSLTEVTRLSPYGGNGMTFMGTDGRTANFTVDGASFNNDFGLSSALPGGGNPISIDAIEEMQVVISPFDVRQTGFIGGGVNAITKSGTNTVKGTAYVYHKNENMRGDAICGEQISGARATDRSTTYGFTLGAPIVKNKLFIFVNGEMTQTPTIANRWQGSDDGVADANNYISRTTKSDLQTVSDYVKNKYGYDTGSYTSFPADESNYKFLARLDWNINDANKLALRYNFTQNRGWNAPNASSMDGGTRMSDARTSKSSMSYANSMYAIDNLVHSVSLDLNSRINESLSNQLLATFSKKDDVRSTTSDEFPMIDILKDNQAYLSLGYELFSWNNAVHTTTWNVKDDVTYYVGDHKIVGGLGYEYQMADNMYMRNGAGYYRYSSLDDFLTGAAPEIVCLTYGYDGETEPAARVRFNKFSAYAQDDWAVSPTFNLSYGLRIDEFVFNNNDLMTNNALLAVDYDGRTMDTGKWPTAKPSFSPRVGFTWDVLGDKSLKLRGGTGLFTGRLPLVFFTNMPSNSGMVQYSAQVNAKNAAKNGFTMDEFAGGLVTDANGKATIEALYNKLTSLGYPTTINPEDGALSSGMCGVDPSFKMPQVWKTSVAADYQFKTSFPLSLTGEFIFNKTINAATIDDWSVPSVAGFARFNGADNRPIYATGYQNGSSLYVLTNTNKGYGWAASLTLNAKPTEWMDFMASYTHQVSKELTSLPGSNASSVLQYIGTVEGPNANNLKLHDGINVTPNRFIASLNIHDNCCNHYSIIYETWNGSYNYTFETVNDMNGDGFNYDNIYIPTDEEVANGEFRFVSDDDAARFMDYVHADKYLSKHQGEYAGTYAYHNPFVHRVDISYKHDFQVNLGNTSHKLQLSADMKNVLNLFNSSWGVQKVANTDFTGSAYDMRVLKYEGVDADGYATFSTPSAINGETETFEPYHAIGQCWYASVGLKYFFDGQKTKGCNCTTTTFDNDALNKLMAENANLQSRNKTLAAENADLRNRPAQKVVEEKIVTIDDEVVIDFAKNSAELTADSKASLDKVPAGATVSIVGATSPEGSVKRNTVLSEQRAKAAADYLEARGVKVADAKGGPAGRVAIVTVK